MKYRITFNDPNTQMERPVQMLTNNWSEVDKWKTDALAKGGPDSYVEIFETREEQVGFFRKPKAEKEADA